ncbi:hypothetical protein COLO4_03977 [Corchorus olitorius]|uniref:Uncharacterized protein n=1 Tax=Corchorus olitorius TaxID=93759 RepID=A0A1R3KTX5_9ROSI|nr:hypothetical protein COLO4_04443 [Corchorus olitorius]OMP11186.1 hypothetical protein COLO4_03977 [Corchorus olitorius]
MASDELAEETGIRSWASDVDAIPLLKQEEQGRTYL